MGFLDGIAGEVLGKVLNNNSQDGLSGIISMASSLIENSGGLSSLVQKFQDAGLGEQVASWISSNSNLPINANQIVSALGENTIGDLASKFNLSNSEVSGGLASMLPKVIDMMTGDGKVSDSPFSIDSLLYLIK